MTLLELTDEERDLFTNWVFQREKAVSEELELLKSLRGKLEFGAGVKEEIASTQNQKPATQKALQPGDTDTNSWINIVKSELAHFSRPVQSGEIVKRLLQKPSLSAKGRRFITKAVTSKLWLLQERGEVNKTRENGRYVYSLIK